MPIAPRVRLARSIERRGHQRRRHQRQADHREPASIGDRGDQLGSADARHGRELKRERAADEIGEAGSEHGGPPRQVEVSKVECYLVRDFDPSVESTLDLRLIYA